MSKESASKVLVVFKWLNLIGAILMGILAIVMFANQNAEFINEISKSMDPALLNKTSLSLGAFLGITFAVSAILSLIKGLLLGRAAKDGKKSTFLLVVTAISVVLGVVTLFSAFNFSNVFSVLFDAFLLYLIFVVRQD